MTQEPAAPEEADRFKEAFKRYKKKSADLSDVTDLSRPSKYGPELVGLPAVVPSCDAAQLGLLPTDQWKIYSLASAPGLLVIPNPFREGAQHYWVKRCLVDYPCLPNICSLDAHFKREGTGRVWPVQGGGQHWAKGREGDMLTKLRWVTLGYHYDWTEKEYSEDHKSPFPPDLARLSSFILEVAGFPGFSAEAAIVNFYHLDSTLSGHTDHSEWDLSHPLLSISLGQSAVFLVGGETKSVNPQALLLHSGDVVVMSGPSRLAYHGVPKILSPSPAALVPRALTRQSLLNQLERLRDAMRPCELKSGSPCQVCERRQLSLDQIHCAPSCDDPPVEKRVKTELEREGETVCESGLQSVCEEWTDMLEEWPAFEQYISTSRININIRQVNTHTLQSLDDV